MSTATTANLNLSQTLTRGISLPIIILVMLATVILPLPTFVLDVLFSFNITFALLILLVCVYTQKPLEFSLFPTIILVSTLMRLTLNVASTRVVLLNGHLGPDAAGDVIKAFGEVVIGGNYAVGMIVFAILVIINFVVVTKGSGRISEVSARFTLDALPGKQMAIDADLNAGAISQDEAKQRRAEITQEADFYGSMDGASKFVRGDAVAGILILFINLIGGLVIGMLTHGMSFSSAIQTYALLTIGDGLVAQIPSLLISIAAGVMVSRVTRSEDMSAQVSVQLFKSPKPLAITACILGFMAIIPGMPYIAFLLLTAVTGGAAYYIHVRNENETVEKAKQPEGEKKDNAEIDWSDVEMIDPIKLEVGYRLINLIGLKKEGALVSCVKGIRKKLSQEIGFLIPAVHIRDNLDLEPTRYRIAIKGIYYGEADIQVDQLMAINPGHVVEKLEGTPTKDPTFGMDAYWISEETKAHASNLGYTVVDPSTVVATHVSQIVQQNISELMDHESVQVLLDRLKEQAPKLTEALTGPEGVTLSVIVKVLQRLLGTRVPVTDFHSIAEAIVDASVHTKDPGIILEKVRIAIRGFIVQRINGMNLELPVMIFDPKLEQILHQSLQVSEQNGGSQTTSLVLEPALAENLFRQVIAEKQNRYVEGQPCILVVSPPLRAAVEKLFVNRIDEIYVISHQEIPEDKQINITATIGVQKELP